MMKDKFHPENAPQMFSTIERVAARLGVKPDAKGEYELFEIMEAFLDRLDSGFQPPEER